MEDLADGFMMEHENELETNLQPKVDIRKNSARFLLQLREAKGLSQVAIDTVVDGCEELISECLRNVQMDIENKIEDPEQLNIIEDAFQQCTKPFDGLHTKHQQEKFFV